MDAVGFREWLRKKAMSERSISDVCSRLNRISKLLDLSKIKSNADLSVAIIRSNSFEPLQPAVRSQLKRAAALWLEFQGPAQ